ncbi:regulatory protein GemA [Halocynthiibacter namhaensis]|uniref:regulatory protein GemA n=1 Tax=Halocynthiibacter namhaensis TaxID=1290553 RepID=UPI000578EBC0|nr:regulatory protein GemA [Halocynthiibacter namhaensis]
MSIRSLQKLVHVGCRELGLDADTRRDLQLVTTGKSSMSDMSEAELNKLVGELKVRGFRPTDRSAKRPASDRPDIRFCHVMWRLLHEAGVAKVAGAKGLNAFVRSRFEKTWGHVPLDIDHLREPAQIRAVVEALKDWCARAGVELSK